MDTPEAQLEFQNFVLNSAEQNLVAGNVGRPKSTQGSAFSSPQRGGGISSGAILPEPAVTRPPGGSSAFWTVEFYQQFFDVDTNDVLQRMLESIVPRGTFMEKVGSNADLYGPFWISTTVIFALFVTSSIAGSIYAYIHNAPYTYDMTLLSIAVSTVYIYVTLLPGLLWGMARYFGSPIKFFDLIDLYGYGMTIWIPVSLLCIIPSELVRWILIGTAFGLSTFFMIQNIIPLLAEASNPVAKTAVMVVIAVAHAGLALLFRFEFFSFVANIGGGGGGGADGGGSVTTTTSSSSLTESPTASPAAF
ncbi:hypothetical protein DFJ73DRAFT_273569 [Zopfochytrium polystomum]|nr:hypothetical protein DFJ73DRAFT_273569 [Zopfochytrium polystomum]